MTEILFDDKLFLSSHKNEYFELYYLQSYPLHFLTLFSNNYHLIHTGIALRSIQSNKIIILEYHPINQTICFIPSISNTQGHQQKLIWNNKAFITISTSYNESYWFKSVYLARINGVVYRHYLDWVQEYIKLHPRFLPYSICLSPQNCPYPKQNWDTFVTDTFEKLSEFAVVINPITKLYESNWIYLTQYVPERILSSNEPTVIQYYSQMLSCLADKGKNTSMDYILATNYCSIQSHTRSISHKQHIIHYEEDTYLLVTMPLSLENSHHNNNSNNNSNSNFNNNNNNNSNSNDGNTILKPNEIFVISYHHEMLLPPPPILHYEKGTSSDYAILLSILLLIIIGIVIALWKVGCIDRVCCKNSLSEKNSRLRVFHSMDIETSDEDETSLIEMSQLELQPLNSISYSS